jgi:protein HIRA/HIR1
MDGLTLYAVSSDGTMGVFNFDADEMEGISPLSAQKDYLKKFGYELPPLPTGFSHKQPSKEAMAPQMTPPPSPSSGKTEGQPQPFGTMVNGGGANHVNQLVAKRNNKKRVQPKFIGSLGGPGSSVAASVPSALSVQQSSRPKPSNFPYGITSDSFDDPAPSAGMSTSIPIPSNSPTGSPSMTARTRLSTSVSNNFTANDGFDDVEMSDVQPHSMQVPISSLSEDDPAGMKGKRKISVMDLVDDGRQSKARTLGGDRAREQVTVREISSSGGPIQRDFGGRSASAMLRTPSLLNYLSAKVDGGQDFLEARNSEGSGKWKITLVRDEIFICA